MMGECMTVSGLDMWRDGSVMVDGRMMDGWMDDRWVDGWRVDRWINEWTDGWVDKWKHRWVDGSLAGWLGHGWINGRVEG